MNNLEASKLKEGTILIKSKRWKESIDDLRRDFLKSKEEFVLSYYDMGFQEIKVVGFIGSFSTFRFEVKKNIKLKDFLNEKCAD